MNYSTIKNLTSEKPSEEFLKKTDTLLFLPANNFRIDEGGLRTKGYFKKNLPDKPLITVITVVYNGVEKLEQTILSVLNQSYDNVEYIIIDGGSKDGTIDVIRKYEDYIDYWVSEKDDGIYDAMNKGIDLAMGKWLNFMNCGDIFYSIEILDILRPQFIRDDVDLIYGDMKLKYVHYGNIFELIIRSGKPSGLYKGKMLFSHQSCFIRGDKHKKVKYDTNIFAADYAFLYKFYLLGNKFLKMDNLIISVFESAGFSQKNDIKSLVSTFKFSFFNTNQLKYKIEIVIMFVVQFVYKILRKILKFFIPMKLIVIGIKIENHIINFKRNKL